MSDFVLELKENCAQIAKSFMLDSVQPDFERSSAKLVYEKHSNNPQPVTRQRITAYDVFGSVKEDSSAGAKDGKPFGVSASNKNVVALRVWNENGQVGITNTSNLTLEGLKRAFESAYSASYYSHRDVHYEFSPLSLEPLTFFDPDLVSLESVQNLIRAAVQCEGKILSSHSAIKNVPYNKVGQSFCSRFYFNSNNAYRCQNSASAFCYFYPLAQEEGKLARQMGHFSIAKSFSNLDYNKCADIAVEKTKKHLNYRKVESGQYTVVFSPESFLDILQSFSNFFNAQNILDKKSLSSKETVGTLIASSLLNIQDVAQHEKNVAKIFFDEEGSPTKTINIVENGLLKNLIHTSFTAKQFNCLPTGHTSLGAKLTAQHHFLRVFSGASSIVQPNIPKLIYVEHVKALHAGINALQGSFSLPFDGFLVEEGHFASIESATVAGDFLSLLKNIIYVSSKEEVTPSGISSEVWVKDLSITGT